MKNINKIVRIIITLLYLYLFHNYLYLSAIKVSKAAKINNLTKTILTTQANKLNRKLNNDFNDGNMDKVACSCKDSAGDDWKTLICGQSCEDFCGENDIIKRDCKKRCDLNLCSVADDKCDTSDESLINAC